MYNPDDDMFFVGDSEESDDFEEDGEKMPVFDGVGSDKINEAASEIIEILMNMASEVINKRMIALEQENQRLRGEVESLQEYKNNEWYLRREYEEKLRKEKEEIKRAKIADLLDWQEVWTVRKTYTSRPKCDKCDKDRLIHFTTPMGRESYEECECKKKDLKYVPCKTHMVGFRTNDNGTEIQFRWFERPALLFDGESKSWDSWEKNKICVKSGNQIPDHRYEDELIFETEEGCLKYCDELNRKEQEKCECE